MAKRSYIKAIRSKQTSPYKGVVRVPEAIQALDGSSKREMSRRSQSALRSWTTARGGASQDMRDAQAEKQMNPHGWSSKKNPICSSCFTQQSLNGACGCPPLESLSYLENQILKQRR